MISGSAVKKGKKVSISSNNDFDIQAVVYSFRDPKNDSASGSVKSAMPPLPWLYHDHALGVIWMLFHKDKKFIGLLMGKSMGRCVTNRHVGDPHRYSAIIQQLQAAETKCFGSIRPMYGLLGFMLVAYGSSSELCSFHLHSINSGISQLQWCRRFLLDLKNSEGEYTGDVEICIQAIQDTLIEQYSKLGTILENEVGKKYSARNKLSKVPDEAIDAILNAERAERTEQVMRTSIKYETAIIQENDSVIPHEFGPNQAVNNNQNGLMVEEFSPMHIREINGASTPSGEEESRTLKLQENNKENKNSEEHCGHRCAAPATIMRPEEIVSFTYEEMLARGVSPCTSEYLTEDMYDGSPFIDQLMEKTADEIIRDGDPTGTNFADMDTNELANFLNSSRTQHLERIKKEIERLYGLEKFMDNINTNGFSAWITEDLARRVANLRDEDVIEVAEKIINNA